MADTDYYKILGINKTASDADIKKAYRKLALKYHPDKTKGDKTLEDKFKEISAAYAVLSDKEKKQQYDTYGSTDFHQRFSQEDIFRNSNIGDILKEFGFGGGGGGFRGFGGGSFSGMGGNPFGGGMGGGMGGGCGRKSRQQIQGGNIEYQIPLTLEEMIQGAQKTISINQGGNFATINVKIPKGLIPGKKIRVAGKGEPSSVGGPSGDLMITSRFTPKEGYELDDHDILASQEIKLTDAILGTQLAISTPQGKNLSLKLPQGTNHKAKMRIPGHGIPHLNGKSSGDLYVVINVEMPKKIDQNQKKLIEKLVKTGL